MKKNIFKILKYIFTLIGVIFLLIIMLIFNGITDFRPIIFIFIIFVLIPFGLAYIFHKKHIEALLNENPNYYKEKAENERFIREQKEEYKKEKKLNKEINMKNTINSKTDNISKTEKYSDINNIKISDSIEFNHSKFKEDIKPKKKGRPVLAVIILGCILFFVIKGFSGPTEPSSTSNPNNISISNAMGKDTYITTLSTDVIDILNNYNEMLDGWHMTISSFSNGTMDRVTAYKNMEILKGNLNTLSNMCQNLDNNENFETEKQKEEFENLKNGLNQSILYMHSASSEMSKILNKGNYSSQQFVDIETFASNANTSFTYALTHKLLLDKEFGITTELDEQYQPLLEKITGLNIN